MIEKYLNKITFETKDVFKPEYEQIEEFVFYGDAEGDFEKKASTTTLKCINDYIDYCEKQIQLAKIAGLEIIQKDNDIKDHEIFVKHLTG